MSGVRGHCSCRRYLSNQGRQQQLSGSKGGRHADSALPSLILVDINSAQRLMLQYNWNGKGWKGGLRTTNSVMSSQPIIPLVGFKKPSLPELVMPGIPDFFQIRQIIAENLLLWKYIQTLQNIVFNRLEPQCSFA